LGRFSAYKLPLKSMPIGTQDFEYVLDNEFFKNIEGEDVQKGKVKVKLTVKRTAASFGIQRGER